MKNRFNLLQMLATATMTSATAFTMPLYAGTTTIITGIDYSTGKYGETTDTEMTYIPVTIKYQSFPWKTKLTVPWLSVTGPESVTVTSGSVVSSGDTATSVRTDSGIGDVSASLAFALDSLLAEPGNTFVDLIGKVKLPTADADARLGTGELDYQVLLDIARSFDGTTPFVTLGYKWMGDTETTDYNNVFSTSVGVDRKISGNFSAGAIFDYAQATTDTSDPRKEIMGYLNWKLSKRFSVNLYGVAGFSDASPDQSVGMQFVLKKF